MSRTFVLLAEDEGTEREPGSPEPWARQIEIVVRSLQSRLGAAVDSARIRAEVEAKFAAYSQARVRDFVPVLVEVQVRSRLARR